MMLFVVFGAVGASGCVALIGLPRIHVRRSRQDGQELCAEQERLPSLDEPLRPGGAIPGGEPVRPAPDSLGTGEPRGEGGWGKAQRLGDAASAIVLRESEHVAPGLEQSCRTRPQTFGASPKPQQGEPGVLRQRSGTGGEPEVMPCVRSGADAPRRARLSEHQQACARRC